MSDNKELKKPTRFDDIEKSANSVGEYVDDSLKGNVDAQLMGEFQQLKSEVESDLRQIEIEGKDLEMTIQDISEKLLSKKKLVSKLIRTVIGKGGDKLESDAKELGELIEELKIKIPELFKKILNLDLSLDQKFNKLMGQDPNLDSAITIYKGNIRQTLNNLKSRFGGLSSRLFDAGLKLANLLNAISKFKKIIDTAKKLKTLGTAASAAPMLPAILIVGGIILIISLIFLFANIQRIQDNPTEAIQLIIDSEGCIGDGCVEQYMRTLTTKNVGKRL